MSTPLMEAVCAPVVNNDVVLRLLNARADATVIDKHGQSILMLACQRLPLQAVGRILFAVGERGLNEGNVYGETPLMYAAASCRLNVVEALLMARANPYACSHADKTALIHARDAIQLRAKRTSPGTASVPSPETIDSDGLASEVSTDMLVAVLQSSMSEPTPNCAAKRTTPSDPVVVGGGTEGEW